MRQMPSWTLSCFQLSVESNSWLLCFCSISHCDWSQKVAPPSHPVRFKLICLFLTWIPTGRLWCRPALQLAFVSTVVLVFRNWTENCSIIKMNLNFDDFVGFKVWNSWRRENETEFLQGDIGKYSICHYNGGLLFRCPLLSRKSADECQYRSNCASTLPLTQNLPIFLSVDYCCYWFFTEFCW